MTPHLKVSTAPTFEINPFIEKAIEQINVKTITKKRFLQGSKGVESLIVDSKDGEIKGHSAFLQVIAVDEEKFTKLYLAQFATFWELDKPSLRVFGYILSNLLPNSDIVYFDLQEAMKHTNYTSKKPIFSGLAKLLSLGFIARSTTHFKYFINPLMFFNGDRVTFAKTYIKKLNNNSAATLKDPLQLELF